MRGKGSRVVLLFRKWPMVLYGSSREEGFMVFAPKDSGTFTVIIVVNNIEVNIRKSSHLSFPPHLCPASWTLSSSHFTGVGPEAQRSQRKLAQGHTLQRPELRPQTPHLLAIPLPQALHLLVGSGHFQSPEEGYKVARDCKASLCSSLLRVGAVRRGRGQFTV